MFREIVHPPVAHWQLLQIGHARVPVLDAETQVSFDAVTAVSQLASGATYDHFSERRAPYKQGTFMHTGLYECCEPCCGAGGNCPGLIAEEIDAISMNSGTYVPFLFVKDYTCVPPCRDTCFAKPTCVTYAWTYGKVESISGPFRVSDYQTPSVSEVSLRGVLAGPLREITHSRYRFGYPLARQTIAARTRMVAAEAFSAEPKAEWFIPCERPSRCAAERFWPRDLNAQYRTGADQFEPEYWDAANVVTVRPPGEMLIRVYGNAPPRLQVLASDSATFSIENDLGKTDYSFPITAAYRAFTDTDTGQVLQIGFADEIKPMPGVTSLPTMEPFENVVRVTHGLVTLGITPQWVT